MKNVTISLDEDLARRARVEAAKRDISLSKYVAELLRERLCRDEEYEAARKSYLSKGTYPIGQPGEPVPGRDEIYDRPVFRRGQTNR